MCFAVRQKELIGATNYQSGLSAEAAVDAHYRRAGFHIRDTRFRPPRGQGAGEIDLIAEQDGQVIFIEVKKSRSHAEAAASLTPRQIGRLTRGAEAYLGRCPRGQNTPCRFDVALVDGAGRIEIIENALAA